jgi:CRP/FNR family transcriptional regulator
MSFPVSKILAAVPYLARLDPERLEVLARAALCREYEPSEVVFLEGEPCAGLFVIESGWVKAIKAAPNGREQVMRFAGPGEVFNEVGIIADSPNVVTIVALEPTTVWVIPRESMIRLLDERPHLARLVAQNLATRVLHLARLVEDLSLRTVEARLARMLLETGGDIVERKRWSTQAEMASRLGTVPDVLNRALRDLVEAELIEVGRQQIRILDREGLEERSTLGI